MEGGKCVCCRWVLEHGVRTTGQGRGEPDPAKARATSGFRLTAMIRSSRRAGEKKAKDGGEDMRRRRRRSSSSLVGLLPKSIPCISWWLSPSPVPSSRFSSPCYVRWKDS